MTLTKNKDLITVFAFILILRVDTVMFGNALPFLKNGSITVIYFQLMAPPLATLTLPYKVYLKYQ